MIVSDLLLLSVDYTLKCYSSISLRYTLDFHRDLMDLMIIILKSRIF